MLLGKKKRTLLLRKKDRQMLGNHDHRIKQNQERSRDGQFLDKFSSTQFLHNCLAVELYSAAVVQWYSGTVVQLCSSGTVVQLYSTAVVITKHKQSYVTKFKM